MGLIIDHEKLWTDGGYSKDNPLINSLNFIYGKAAEFKVPHAADYAINSVFMEMAEGKQYPLDTCPCGCNIGNSGTAATHAMLAILVAQKEKFDELQYKMMLDKLNAAIVTHTENENAKFMKENMPKKRGRPKKKKGGGGGLLSFKESPILKMLSIAMHKVISI